MLKDSISITAISSISPIGDDEVNTFHAYTEKDHCFGHKVISGQEIWVGELPDEVKGRVKRLRRTSSKYEHLDLTVLYAIYCARKALKKVNWVDGDFGINIGSSRGATRLFEKHYDSFLKEGSTSTLTSPTTTLGNIASWVAHDLQSDGPVISHSITCSTALHAMLNGIAWLQADMADKFLVGGSEAPLTPFTIAQMKALKIYSKLKQEYPCRALDGTKTTNSMILGEGAAIACLQKGKSDKSLAEIIGIGYATEPLVHNVSISSDAQCFQNSMKMALGSTAPEEVDAIVMHAPGTIKGDASEQQAIHKVFQGKIPFLTSNKWKIGHTFGASGMLSIELAISMLKAQKPLPVPFISYKVLPKKMEKVLVNAVGFGGNAVSILLAK